MGLLFIQIKLLISQSSKIIEKGSTNVKDDIIELINLLTGIKPLKMSIFKLKHKQGDTAI